ncbi:MmcQ/YjbR family DNA-binding protein [Niveispirillum irakense]|uniref:MmcQ/YjbR family DNA-binding protein n=1 Tax=Niveispirillum irakense TaxID=34011 RepID=UPI000417A8FC|nr:MmcQ/YjbR family DNA-binding protein [Niveispirillum irakense]
MTGAAPCPAFPEAEKALLDNALSLPEAVEDFPWGDRVLKVRGKIFLFLAQQKGGLRLSMKLPFSRDFALDLPEATPTGYGLGKSGWVTFIYQEGSEPDVPRLIHWMGESYRAVAPKKLVARMEGAMNA